MPESIYTGGCLCGTVRYQSLTPPLRCVICHCQQCRKHSGSACLGFVHFDRNSFSWLGAEPARYRSSKYAERGFCAKCGSTLSMHEEVLDDRVQISIGSLDDPNRVSPDDHVWDRSRVLWFNIDDQLPRFQQSSSAVESKATED